jgi:hypothetical protein
MTPDEEKAETCRVAMKAALEAMNDYCGTGETGKQEPDVPTIRFLAGHDVPMDYIPEDIFHIIDESPSSMSAIDKLIEYELEYAKKKIAETLYWSRSKGTLETAKERAKRVQG